MEKGKFDPLPPLNPLTVDDYVGDIYHPAELYSDRISGFASAHARLHTPLFTGLFLFFFWGGRSSNYHLQPRRHHIYNTDIDGSAQGCAFYGSQNQNLTSTPFPQKSPFWGPISTILGNCRPKTALTLDVLTVNGP